MRKPHAVVAMAMRVVEICCSDKMGQCHPWRNPNYPKKAKGYKTHINQVALRLLQRQEILRVLPGCAVRLPRHRANDSPGRLARVAAHPDKLRGVSMRREQFRVTRLGVRPDVCDLEDLAPTGRDVALEDADHEKTTYVGLVHMGLVSG